MAGSPASGKTYSAPHMGFARRRPTRPDDFLPSYASSHAHGTPGGTRPLRDRAGGLLRSNLRCDV
jgi:hypothetical protein